MMRGGVVTPTFFFFFFFFTILILSCFFLYPLSKYARNHWNIIMTEYIYNYSPLNDDQIHKKDALVHFVLKDYDMIRSNELVGEAFVSFSAIQSSETPSDIQHIIQQHLPLTRPYATTGT
jgi:hypothetical protein